MKTVKTLNINDLLADLEKTAGIEKTASVAKPNVSAELSGILEKKSSENITASALAAGEALARELLTKMADDSQAMALAKGDATLSGVKEANLIQQGDAVIVASDNAKIVPNDGAPGTGTTATVGLDGALDGTVAEGLKRGAQSDDIVDQMEDKKQTKQAAENSENSEMAKKIMQKIAQIVGEATTTPAAAVNTAAAAAPNLIQSGNETMTAADDKKVLPLPGADGSMNTILEAIVARAEDQGAVSDDLVNGDSPASSAPGDDEVLDADEQEKAAAVSALVGQGCDFDSAVAMVKQAEELLAVEADQQEKIAAISELCGAGYDFETAVALVKQAEAELANEGTEMDKVAAVNELMAKGASFEEAVEQVKVASKKDEKEVKEKKGFKPFTKKDFKERAHEKKAAFDALIEAGIDFDQATAMVKQAEIDVYGAE